MIKAIIFDMDGLMFDTESAYSVVHTSMAKKRNKEFNNEIKMKLMSKRANEVMEIQNAYWGQNENTEDLLKEQDDELIKIYKESVEKLPGLDNLLSFLNENGIRKCIGTSSRRSLANVLLEKHHLKDEFEFIISGDDVDKGKPNPEIYNKCIAKLKLPVEECLVLEDSLNGVKAALAAGCHACAIPSEYTKHENFPAESLICSSLADDKIKEFILK